MNKSELTAVCCILTCLISITSFADYSLIGWQELDGWKGQWELQSETQQAKAGETFYMGVGVKRTDYDGWPYRLNFTVALVKNGRTLDTDSVAVEAIPPSRSGASLQHGISLHRVHVKIPESGSYDLEVSIKGRSVKLGEKTFTGKCTITAVEGENAAKIFEPHASKSTSVANHGQSHPSGAASIKSSGHMSYIGKEAGFSGEVSSITDKGTYYDLEVKYSVFDVYGGAIVSGCLGVDSKRLANGDFFRGNPPNQPGATGTARISVPKDDLTPGAGIYIMFDWYRNTSNYSTYYERDKNKNDGGRILRLATFR